MKQVWTLEKLRSGFERFKEEHGHYPIAPEIDRIDYLPSSRQIQRKYGGLEKLRGMLGHEDLHFGRGTFRAEIANRSGSRGRTAELELEKKLRGHFGEVFVHTERIFDDSKNRVDFYVYSPDGNFGIDVFYTDTMRDLQKNINIKIDKYKNFPGKLYFVVANKEFAQADLDLYMSTKKKALNDDARILSMSSLMETIENLKSYPNPLVG